VPKSKLRPKAVEKKKRAQANKVATKPKAAESGNPGGKTYYANSLAGAVKLGSGVKKTSFHNRKGGGE